MPALARIRNACRLPFLLRKSRRFSDLPISTKPSKNIGKATVNFIPGEGGARNLFNRACCLVSKPTPGLYNTNKPKVAPPGREWLLKQTQVDKVKSEILIAPLFFLCMNERSISNYQQSIFKEEACTSFYTVTRRFSALLRMG